MQDTEFCYMPLPESHIGLAFIIRCDRRQRLMAARRPELIGAKWRRALSWYPPFAMRQRLQGSPRRFGRSRIIQGNRNL